MFVLAPFSYQWSNTALCKILKLMRFWNVEIKSKSSRKVIFQPFSLLVRRCLENWIWFWASYYTQCLVYISSRFLVTCLHRKFWWMVTLYTLSAPRPRRFITNTNVCRIKKRWRGRLCCNIKTLSLYLFSRLFAWLFVQFLVLHSFLVGGSRYYSKGFFSKPSSLSYVKYFATLLL